MTFIGKDYALISGGHASGLHQALDKANMNPSSPYNIFLEAGTYDILGTRAAFGQIKMYGAGIDNTIIRQGQQDPNLMAGILTVNASAVLELHNLTLKDGLAKAPQHGAVEGAGVKIWSGTLKAYDCKFENNDAQGPGGAIRNLAGRVEIYRCIFSGNKGSVGGAIANSSSLSNAVYVDQAQFTGNHANDSGGAIAVLSGSPSGLPQVQNSSFLAGNTAVNAYPHIYNSAPVSVDASNNWWDPSPQVSPNVTTSPVLPSQPALPSVTPEQKMVDELATYGITAFVAGTGGSSQGTGTAKAWTLAELWQNLIGVQHTARAYNLLKNNDASGTNPQAKALFQTVMGPFEILRVENGYQIGGCNGVTDKACVSNANDTIVWFGNVNVVQHTLVHEFGHFFNDRSVGAFENAFHDGGNFVLRDCGQDGVPGGGDDAIVIGHTGGNDWERGRRGWGSGPEQSLFQQDFVEDPDKTQNEITEAAADMFLNWVYRRNSDQAPTGSPCTMPATGIWEGFLNMDWFSNPSGVPDYTRKPGNARYQWMEDTLSTIFTAQNW